MFEEKGHRISRAFTSTRRSARGLLLWLLTKKVANFKHLSKPSRGLPLKKGRPGHMTTPIMINKAPRYDPTLLSLALDVKSGYGHRANALLSMPASHRQGSTCAFCAAFDPRAVIPQAAATTGILVLDKLRHPQRRPRSKPGLGKNIAALQAGIVHPNHAAPVVAKPRSNGPFRRDHVKAYPRAVIPGRMTR